MERVLLLGCGARRNRLVKVMNRMDWTGQRLITLDIHKGHKPDILWDLNRVPWPAPDNEFEEVHAYDVLEHLGRQGDPMSFFQTFYEIWRILKPGGFLGAVVPNWKSEWVWGDPGHTRLISAGSLAFLNQQEYVRVGNTPMSDYRSMWNGDFAAVWMKEDGDRFLFALQAIKPKRIINQPPAP